MPIGLRPDQEVGENPRARRAPEAIATPSDPSGRRIFAVERGEHHAQCAQRIPCPLR